MWAATKLVCFAVDLQQFSWQTSKMQWILTRIAYTWTSCLFGVVAFTACRDSAVQEQAQACILLNYKPCCFYNVQLHVCLLQVGSSSSRKSSLARALAYCCGRKLVEMPVNSAMDTTELLGGFEQVRQPQHRTFLFNYWKSLTRDQPVQWWWWV